MNIAYIRANSEQSILNQKNKLKEHKIDEWYIETLGNKERTAFKELISNIKTEDTIVISDLSRISRNMEEVLKSVDLIKSKGAIIKVLNSPIDFNSPEGKLALCAALAIQEELAKVEEN